MKAVFKQQQGVVLTQVCGEYLLVATREAFGKCPYVNRIGEFESTYWKLMSEKKSPGEIMHLFMEKYDLDMNSAVHILSYATDKFTKAGYFVQEITEDS